MHTGQVILTIRLLLGISQKELAKRLKIRVKTLETIETMAHHTETGIHKIAVALAIQPEDITDFDGGKLKMLLLTESDPDLNKTTSLVNRILSSGKTTTELIELLQEK